MRNDRGAMAMHHEWLLAHAGAPVRYSLTHDSGLLDALVGNEEVGRWLERLSARARAGDLASMHGSHDYRYENIVGKCCVLGLDRDVPAFAEPMRVYLDFLRGHLREGRADAPQTFAKLYAHRDYETVLACYLPLMGYGQEDCVQQVAHRRMDALDPVAGQGRYDIYVPGARYPGVKADWLPYVVDPALYRDGHIGVPSMHDYILLAGMYRYLDARRQAQVRRIVDWLFDPRYAGIHDRYYYYAPDDPHYRAKAIDGKAKLCGLPVSGQGEEALRGLLWQCYVFSHFPHLHGQAWFQDVYGYLARFRTAQGRYVFARGMISEKKDVPVHKGGHMNVGEDRSGRLYAEIVSTLWMARIEANLRAEAA